MTREETIEAIKPTKKFRRWAEDEVPLGAWMRLKDGCKKRWLINETYSELNRQDWLEHYEHSTDCGKTWLPCGVEETNN